MRSLQYAGLSVLRVLRTPPCLASKVRSTPPPPDLQESCHQAQARLPQDSAPGIRAGRSGPRPAASRWWLCGEPAGRQEPCRERTGHRGQQGLKAGGHWLLMASHAQVQVTGPWTRAARPGPLSHRGQNSARAARRPGAGAGGVRRPQKAIAWLPTHARWPGAAGIRSLQSLPWEHVGQGLTGQRRVADTRNGWLNCPLP